MQTANNALSIYVTSRDRLNNIVGKMAWQQVVKCTLVTAQTEQHVTYLVPVGAR